MFLTSTDKTIEVLLGGAVTTNQLHIFSSYGDHTSSTFTPGSGSTVTNNTTPVTVVAAPGASTQRQVFYISIYNNDTVDATVTIRLNDNSTTRILVKPTLKTGETLEYNYQSGWTVITSGGLVKSTPVTHLIKDTAVLPTGFLTGSIAGTKSTGTNITYAVHMGRAQKAYTSASVQYRVTTAAVTITWAEVGIATGPILIGGPGASTDGTGLTTRGSTDVSGVVNTTGIKTTSVTISGIQPGDDLWMLIGNQASTPMILRSSSNADNITSGRYLQGPTGARPSTMGANTPFGLDSSAYAWTVVSFS